MEVAKIHASLRWQSIPSWALLERQLLSEMSQSVRLFLDRYTDSEGQLIWGGDGSLHGRDDKDDFYEAFYNWPLLYVLGGSDELLEISHRCWEAVTEQLTRMGLLDREYDTGADFFHQGEGLMFFFFLCLADPSNERLQERAVRFADFYTGEDAAAQNFDSAKNMILAPHTGSRGPVFDYQDGDPAPDWPLSMGIYGLPLSDVAGILSFDDLSSRANARRFGLAMNERLGRGDVIANLGVTSLMTNAFLMNGDPRFSSWTQNYVRMWMDRANENGGQLPDNIGPDGQVGSLLSGKWYGGLYGWTWPHGLYNIAQCTAIAAMNAYLLSGDETFLDLPWAQFQQAMARGRVADLRQLPMSLVHHWLPHFGFLEETQLRYSPAPVETFVVPYRHGDQGWFDYQPVLPAVPVNLWHSRMDSTSGRILDNLFSMYQSSWSVFVPGREKEDGGHEGPWLNFLAGTSDEYPDVALSSALANVARRLEQIRLDKVNLTQVPDDEIHGLVHHWQKLNPVTTEALVQLTLGCPQHLYNGGLVFGRVRYFCGETGRSGLPKQCSALITELTENSVVLILINLSTIHTTIVVVQAGMFAEHSFLDAKYTYDSGPWPGPIGSYVGPAQVVEEKAVTIDASHVQIVLPAASQITVRFKMRTNVCTPTYDHPVVQDLRAACAKESR